MVVRGRACKRDPAHSELEVPDLLLSQTGNLVSMGELNDPEVII